MPDPDIEKGSFVGRSDADIIISTSERKIYPTASPSSNMGRAIADQHISAISTLSTVGQGSEGEAAGNLSGYSIYMNREDSVVAIGAYDEGI